MLTDILFPTLEPNVPTGKPTFGSITGGSSLVFVGAQIPTKNTFTYSIKNDIDDSRGYYYYKTPNGNIDGDFYAGEPTFGDITIAPDGSEFGGTFEEGVYTISGSVKFAAGEQPLTNKGGVATGVTAYGGKEEKLKKEITAVYPIYVTNNSSNIENFETHGPVNYFTGATITGLDIPKEDDVNKLKIKIPTGKKLEVYQFNNLSQSYSSQLYFEKIKDEEIVHNGKSCTYEIHEKKGPAAESQRIQIKISIPK